MKMRTRTYLTAAIAIWSLAPSSQAGENPATRTSATDAEKTLAELGRLVGGTWASTDPKVVVEFRYEWAFHKKVIRGLGVIDKGGPHEQQGEAILGLDTVNNTVYYLDCHGGSLVYKGTVKRDGNSLVFEFATLIGPPARWRQVVHFTDPDTMQFVIFGEKEGNGVPVVKQTSKRRQAEAEPDRLVTEGVVDAPVDAVWAAFTTKQGQESWNVAHAQIDLRVGGRMLTHYDPKGHIGDPNTIENIILSFEPKHMLSIRVANPPEKFPFKNAIKKVWTVIHFEDVGPSRTRLRVVGIGYGEDEESRKLRSFFDKGNSYTIKKLQEKLAGKAKGT